MSITAFLLGLAMTAQAATNPATDPATIEAATGVTPVTMESVTAVSESSPAKEPKEAFEALPQGRESQPQIAPAAERSAPRPTPSTEQSSAPAPRSNTPPPPTEQLDIGGTYAGIFPSGRTLPEDEAVLDIENFLFWRLAWGVTDRLMAEVRSAWGFSLGIGLKYALAKTPGHTLSVGASAEAAVFSRSDNFSRVSMMYTRDYDQGAIHLSGHAMRLQTRRLLDGLTGGDPDVMFIPQVVMGGEARLRENLLGVLNVGYGENLLTPTHIANTGYIDLGFRVGGHRAFADLLLIVPMTAEWLEQDFLGIPYIRVGASL